MMTSGSTNWSRKRLRLLCPLAGVSALGPKTVRRASASVWLSPSLPLVSRRSCGLLARDGVPLLVVETIDDALLRKPPAGAG